MRFALALVGCLLVLVPASVSASPGAQSCRPSVLATASVLDSDGGEVVALTVTLQANAEVSGGDALSRVALNRISNGVVEVDGVGRSIPTVVTLSPPRPSWSFVLRKRSRGAPFQVEFVATDRCGDVPKFAGAGGGSGSAAPAPTSTPSPTATATPTPTPSSLPPLPTGWPATLQLGMHDRLGSAAQTRATASFGFRSHPLSGGVNTGSGWANWIADGRFVTRYIEESAASQMIPVFSYFNLLESAPGNTLGEADGYLANLQNAATMTAYYNDLKLFFRRAGELPGTTVVFHAESDFWAFAQLRSIGDDAATVPASVASTGLPELAGLPDNLVGFAGAIARLRDTYAPNVLLGYHLSTWGTGQEIIFFDPADAVVDTLATRASRFFNSLHGRFDIVFTQIGWGDAAYRQHVLGDGGVSWLDAGDHRRIARFLTRYVGETRQRVVIWGIPYGNTRMRAMNNTWGHYQDNVVEWLLDDPGRAHLYQYVQAGVVAFLFGSGPDGATCACDARADGITNPPPINGNTGQSLSGDDDGGFFRQKAGAYYAGGALRLP